MGDAARDERVLALAKRLDHDDRSQLIFQVQEIAGERCYARHGVSVGPGATVLDVGANVGVAAVWFAACGAAAVHCFEPAPPNVAMLRRNVAELPACSVHPYGLGARAQTATVTWYAGAAAMAGFYTDPARDKATVRAVLGNLGIHGADADAQLAGRYDPQPYGCEIRTLSAVLKEQRIERIDLLKIDVERSELDVLDGVIDADWPRIRQAVIEVHDVDGRLGAIAVRLTARGFVVATDQDDVMRGTSVRLLYARRP